jgi:hypothetical protein
MTYIYIWCIGCESIYFGLRFMVFHCVVSLHNTISRGQEPGASRNRQLRKDESERTKKRHRHKRVQHKHVSEKREVSVLFDDHLNYLILQACSKDQWVDTDSLITLSVARFSSLFVCSSIKYLCGNCCQDLQKIDF